MLVFEESSFKEWQGEKLPAGRQCPGKIKNKFSPLPIFLL